MTISRATASQKISEFYNEFLPKGVAADPSYIPDAIRSFNINIDSLGTSVEQSFSETILVAVRYIAFYDQRDFITPMPAGPSVEDLISALPNSSILVNYLYSSATPQAKAEAIRQLDSGTLGKGAFVLGIGVADQATPTLNDIKNGAATLGRGPSAELPNSSLHLDGINESQQEFLVAMYLGAFGRAPENGGLKFWANDLKGFLNSGLSQADAFLAVSNRIFEAGKVNGEKGTNLNDHDYAKFSYENILGRAPDDGGLKYWVDRLDNHTLTRGDYLATFLGAAQHSVRDYAYLDSRISVSEFVAHEKVSGDNLPRPDLYGVLSGVVDNASAQGRIDSLVHTYGVEILGVKSDAVFDTWMGY